MSRIVRGFLPHENSYTQVPNVWARDEALSYKARGLLLVLLSHRAGFETTMEALRTEHDGETSVRSAVRELEAAGYLKRERLRNGMGQLGDWQWTLVDPERENHV